MSTETQPAREKSQPRLFISHRHTDREIADVIRRFVTYRSGNDVIVHQSPSKAMQFDIHFQRFAGSAGAESISIPLPNGDGREPDSDSVSG